MIQQTKYVFFNLLLSVLMLVSMAVHALADVWHVDYSRSHLGFVVFQGQQKVEGSFERFTADIKFNPLALEESVVDVIIDMASIGTGNATYDATVKQYAWLNVKEYPQARFTTQRFRHRGTNRYEADAILSIRGKDREVILPFTLNISDDRAEVHGILSILRTDFGVGQGVWASGDMVSLEVEIVFSLTATRRLP